MIHQDVLMQNIMLLNDLFILIILFMFQYPIISTFCHNLHLLNVFHFNEIILYLLYLHVLLMLQIFIVFHNLILFLILNLMSIILFKDLLMLLQYLHKIMVIMLMLIMDEMKQNDILLNDPTYLIIIMHHVMSIIYIHQIHLLLLNIINLVKFHIQIYLMYQHIKTF